MAGSSGRAVHDSFQERIITIVSGATIALAASACGSNEASAPLAAATAEPIPLQLVGMAPNGQPYPRPVPCRVERQYVSVYAGDLAKLGVVGSSSAPDGSTPLVHYRSATADLARKTMEELRRLHGAGLMQCQSPKCDGGSGCGLFVREIKPDTPDGSTNGEVMAHNPGVPLRWAPAADFRTVRYATSESGPSATGVLILQVGCSGCGPSAETPR